MKTAQKQVRRFLAKLNVFAFLAAALLVAAPAGAQVVTFPDANLENAVRNALNIQSPTPITQANMLTLTNLPAAFSSIQDLTGLSYASNLMALDLGFNNVTNLAPIAGLVQLTNLHVGWNPVADCSPLSGLTNLLFLDMNSSQFTNISPLSGLHSLAQLIVPWNHLTDASPVATLTNLYYLDIGGNSTNDGYLNYSITNITALTNLHKLQWLSLYSLHVADLSSLSGLTLLTNLDVSWNGAPAHFSVLNGLTNLQLLHLTADTVTNISMVSHMPVLHDLDFGYNAVQDLSPVLGRPLINLQAYYENPPLTNSSLVTNFPQLQQLSLGGEALTNISFLSALTNIQQLWIDGNPGMTNISAILNYTNMWHLDVDGDAFTNFPALVALAGNLNYLELNNVAKPLDISFLAQLVNLNNLDIGQDDVGSLEVLTNLPFLNNLDVNTGFLTDITPLLSMPNLGSVDVSYNLLDDTTNSTTYNTIVSLQQNFVYITFLPQNISPALTVWDSPVDVCASSGGSAYFGVAGSTTNGNNLTYQWQFNGTDIAGATNDSLTLMNITTNEAGSYRAIMGDGNGFAASLDAQLMVNSTNCGSSITILEQPVDTVAALGDYPTFTVVAMTTLSNLTYTWLYDGTNISTTTLDYYDDGMGDLTLNNVTTNDAGTYQVLVSDSSSNVVASVPVQLDVVTTVNFPDPVLAAQIYSQLNLSPGSTIYLTNLDNIYSLNLNGLGITDITGLGYLRNLGYLDLGNNNITNASILASDTSLYALYMESCGLQDASFITSLEGLAQLDLSYNSIHEIPDMQNLALSLYYFEINDNGPLIYYERLAALTNLNTLGVHDDGIADIDFVQGMTGLQQLDAGSDNANDAGVNTVTDISPLIGKNQMWWLSLSWDQVTNMSIITPFSGMQNLYITSNHFDNINFVTNMPLLDNLAINWSTVTNFGPLAGHTPLSFLDISYVGCTNNLSVVSGLTNLNVLWTGGNGATSASYVTNLTNLSYLGIEHNNISDLSPLTQLSNLFYLTMEWNQITNVNVLIGKTNLNYLYLSDNQVHNVSALSGLTNLQSLSLDANGITNVGPLAGLTKLNWLVLQSNYVQNVTPLAGLTNLYWTLDISANQITDITPLTNLTILTWLGVYQNNLTFVPVMAGMTNLTSIDFWGNQLTNISGLANMPNMTWLGFSQNKLTTIQGLVNLPKLNSLNLNTNPIVDASGVAGLTSLNWLNINDARLQTVHPLIGLTNLYYIDVRTNWLNTNAGTQFAADLATFQSHNTYVDYIPQNALLLSSPVKGAGNHVQFSVMGPAGDVVQILDSPDLKSWNTLATLTNTTGSNTFVDTNTPGTKLFYKARE